MNADNQDESKHHLPTRGAHRRYARRLPIHLRRRRAAIWLIMRQASQAMVSGNFLVISL